MNDLDNVAQMLQLVPDDDPTDVRILVAAAQLVGQDGEHAATMTAIAEKAGVGRATIFRRFGTKREIVDRALMRELREFAAGLLETAAAADSPAAALTELFVRSVRITRQSPMLRRLAMFEPEKLVGFARLQEPAAMQLARSLVLGIVSGFDSADPNEVDCLHLADLLCHLAISYAVVPDSSMDLSDEEQLRRVVGSVIAPLFAQT